MATQVVLLQKTILIWDGRNHLSVTLLIWIRQPRYTAEEGFLLHESQPIGVHFCWVMQWWHLLGMIKSLLKSICWRQSTAAAGLTVIPDTTTEKIKTWLLPCLCRLQMNIMYQCDAWSRIKNWVDVVLHRHFHNYLLVNMVKLYIIPIVIMVNSTYYLVLRGANTMCAGGEWDLGSYMGFVGQPNTLLQCTHLDSNKS